MQLVDTELFGLTDLSPKACKLLEYKVKKKYTYNYIPIGNVKESDLIHPRSSTLQHQIKCQTNKRSDIKSSEMYM